MPPFTVRRFAPHEWRTYRDLRLSALAEAPDAFGSTYDLEAARNDAQWEDRVRLAASSEAQFPALALTGETPVGLAWARRDDANPTLGHVFQFWVAPPSRGHGVGHLLMEAVIEWARTLGVATLRLNVTPSHPAAARLYRRAGFVNHGTPTPLRPGSSIFAQPMQLTLEPPSRTRRPDER